MRLTDAMQSGGICAWEQRTELSASFYRQQHQTAASSLFALCRATANKGVSLQLALVY